MNAEQETAYRADLRRAEAARAVLEHNEAAMAYFDEVERKAIDALLACAPTEDLERLRLATMANVVRQFRQALRDCVTTGDFVAQLLGRTTPQGDEA